MTREKAREASEIMKAYADGKGLQILRMGVWENCDIPPLFNWNNCEYRIKPEPKYIPFTYEDREQLRGKWLMHKNYDKDQYMIVRIDTNGVSIKVDHISYQDLFDKYLFSDGSPCGKVIE